VGCSWLVTKLTRGRLRPPVGWAAVAGGGAIAGIGFTVSLLVADLSFGTEEADAAKSAVLVGSLAAGLVAAVLLGRRNRAHR
jgi:Na+:H+ antiporter, NhaA family